MNEIEAIIEQLSIYPVLQAYGVQFYGGGQPEQIHCPFHGDDVNKSARVYPEDDSIYCFTCDKRWNVIDFVQEKEELTLPETLRLIRSRWGIEITMPDYEARFYAQRHKPTQDVLEFNDTVESLFIKFADDLTAGELSSILMSYNECLAKKDSLVGKESFTTEELKRWYEESKAKIQLERTNG
jgi:DNA primase